MPKLTARREAFCWEYLKDLNRTQAALRAGYSTKSAGTEGSRLMQIEEVLERIQEIRTELQARTDVTPEKIVRELAQIAFADIGDVLRRAHDGESLSFDFDKMPPHFTKSIASIDIQTFMDGRGARGREVKEVKLKMIDKRGALVDLAKMYGMMREQVDHNITTKHDDEFEAHDDATLEAFLAKQGVVTQAKPLIAVEATPNLPGVNEQQGRDGDSSRDLQRTDDTKGAVVEKE